MVTAGDYFCMRLFWCRGQLLMLLARDHVYVDVCIFGVHVRVTMALSTSVRTHYHISDIKTQNEMFHKCCTRHGKRLSASHLRQDKRGSPRCLLCSNQIDLPKKRLTQSV